MTKAMVFRVSVVLALSVVLTFGAVAQQSTKVQPTSHAKPAGPMLPMVAKVTANAPVTLTDNGDTWTMNNGIVKMSLLKRNGNMTSLVYHGVEVLTHGQYWEQTPAGTITAKVTIDPATNGGERAEVSVKGVYKGDNTQAPVGAGDEPRGSVGLDIETRFTLERGTSGFYTYAEYTHKASYPAAGEGESRFVLEGMNPNFNWLSIDKDRNMLMCNNQDEQAGVVLHAKEQKILTTGVYKNSVEHKYSYNAVMYKLQAWGWSSTKDHIGVYFINPSTEYIGGGAEKLDLTAHFSTTTMNVTLLDYWTSGHYGGGAGNNIPTGEDWKHVVGPIFVYFNSLADPKDPSKADLDKLAATSGSGMPAVPRVWHDNALALWNDAVAKSKSVKSAWPYSWVEGVDYPHKDGRATITGQLVLDDPQADKKTLLHLTVGLAHPNYPGNGSAFQMRAGNNKIVTWAHDGNYYQFWADGAADGRFTIANVRPGKYTLHAFADGVLGEYAKANITVETGKKIDLGKLDWQPVRYGKQIWEIGYPDRTGDKFFKGDVDNYWLWGWGLRYSGLFPNDITYTIGKSDYRKDWFFQEVPHSTTTAWLNPAAKDPYNQRFGWVNNPTGTQDMWSTWGHGRATTWTVKFNMPKASPGSAMLRIALAGADSTRLAIGVNGHDVGSIQPASTNALRYNTDTGVWYQYIQKFDAGLLKAGENSVTFTVPAGDVTSGVVWDYVRLELNDGGKAYPTPPDNQRPDMPTLE